MSNNGYHLRVRNGESSILRTERLSKVYIDGQVNALVDVNLEIHRGEYVSIMGPSGSGKSTLLNMLGMLDRPTSGEVYLDGQPVSRVKTSTACGHRNRFRLPVVLPAADALGIGERAGADVRGQTAAGASGRRRRPNCWSWSTCAIE